jgi:hypothetical protein
MIAIRTSLTLIGVIAAILLSPWITALCIVLLSVRYRAVEAIALGALLDFLWLPHNTLLTMFPLCTIMAIIVVWGFEPLRLEFLR